MASNPSDKQHMNNSDENLRDIARHHRWVMIALAATSIYYFVALPLNLLPSLGPCGLSGLPFMVSLFVFIAIKLYSLTSFVRLSESLNDPVIVSIIQFLLMFVFLIDVAILAIAALPRALTVRAAGVNIRWYWISPTLVSRQMSAELCTRCGYNLTGNVSGRCPECGTPTERAASPL
jgi:hypothetical protein